jgi:hypothetical protein
MEMTEHEHLIKKATFCQGERNTAHALVLWEKAVRMKPLDHLSMLNRLLCIRELRPEEEQMHSSMLLLKEASAKKYFEACVIFAMLSAFDAGQTELASKIALVAAERAHLNAVRLNANVWDLAGEPTFVSESGAVSEKRDSGNILRCLSAILRDCPLQKPERDLLFELLNRHKERDEALKQRLPSLPPEKAWWKFW